MARGRGTRAGLSACALALAVALAPSAHAATPIEQREDLRPGLQVSAMRTALRAAPVYFSGFNSGCLSTTPMLTYVDSNVMAGNFRDQDGGCYVWLNMEQSPLLDAREICKLALHEMGHLTGLRHSDDESDVMYSPFAELPIPQPCVKPLPRAKTSKRKRRVAARR